MATVLPRRVYLAIGLVLTHPRFHPIHRRLYGWTGGRGPVGRALGMDMLLVETRGRRTGEPRIIPLGGRPHVGGNIRQWIGDSRGRWDGDTLVVDTTNFADKASFRGSTRGLHLVERFTRVNADTVKYEFTIDDPTTFTRQWTAAIPMARTDEQIYEYACHEGNYGMVNLLSGARVKEKTETPDK